VAGAVTGGGLTVIANAPNPAGISILREHFSNHVVNPIYLIYAAIIPTVIAILAFRFI
jgi:Na+/H+ antiporter NhaD/arsenite permease-like protein